MISTDLRGLISAMKAHIDAETCGEAFLSVFAQRLREIAGDVETLEGTTVPQRLRRRPSETPQLELIEGGRR